MTTAAISAVITWTGLINKTMDNIFLVIFYLYLSAEPSVMLSKDFIEELTVPCRTKEFPWCFFLFSCILSGIWSGNKYPNVFIFWSKDDTVVNICQFLFRLHQRYNTAPFPTMFSNCCLYEPVLQTKVSHLTTCLGLKCGGSSDTGEKGLNESETERV